MAVTAATITGVKPNVAGARRQVTRTITFDNSYPTGGEAVAASVFGLKRIQLARAHIVSGFAAGFAHVDPLRQTDGSLLLRLRAAAGTEVANATDASTVVAEVTVEGY